MPGLTAVAMTAGQTSYAATNSLSYDAVFAVVDGTALGSLYGVSSGVYSPTTVHNPSAKKSDVIPIRSSTAPAWFSRALHFSAIPDGPAGHAGLGTIRRRYRNRRADHLHQERRD